MTLGTCGESESEFFHILRAYELVQLGEVRRNAQGLEIRCTRWNQLIGSQQTVAGGPSCRPSGTPGEVGPEEKATARLSACLVSA